MKSFHTEAQQLMDLLNLLTLFTRKTMIEWLPSFVDKTGITNERFMVLYELMLQPNSSLKQLAEASMVSSSSLSIMINSMVESGLVDRKTDPTDRRRVLLSVSEQGESAIEEIEKRLRDAYAQFLKELPSDEQKELSTLSVHMIAVIQKILHRSNPGA